MIQIASRSKLYLIQAGIVLVSCYAMIMFLFPAEQHRKKNVKRMIQQTAHVYSSNINSTPKIVAPFFFFVDQHKTFFLLPNTKIFYIIVQFFCCGSSQATTITTATTNRCLFTRSHFLFEQKNTLCSTTTTTRHSSTPSNIVYQHSTFPRNKQNIYWYQVCGTYYS